MGNLFRVYLFVHLIWVEEQVRWGNKIPQYFIRDRIPWKNSAQYWYDPTSFGFQIRLKD